MKLCANVSNAIFPVIIYILIAVNCIRGVAGHPMWMRSVGGDEDMDGNETNPVVPDNICYSLELDNNITSSVELMGQTTALFKLADIYEQSWEANMILDLNERFAKRGFNKATFVIILPLPADEDPENSTLPILASETGNVSVIYENEDLEHLPVDSVTVIDACGIVVYSIILPWSSMQYPYVKAAILSAMFDQPCGTCEKSPSDNSLRHPLFDKPSHFGNEIFLDLGTSGDKESRQAGGFEDLENTNNALNLSSSSTLEPDEDAGYLIPMRVIIPAEHVHRASENPFGKFEKYNYYVLKTDDNSFHGHLDSDPPEIVGVWRDLEAGIIPVKDEDPQETTVTTAEPESTSPTTMVTNSISDEPVFGFPGSSIYTFSSPTDNEIASTTPIASELSGKGKLDRTDPLVYVNDDTEKFRVRKKYRFGDSVSYNERNFDEVEILRDQMKTFITPLEGDVNGNKNTPRHLEEHYENILPWLDFII